MDTKTILFVLVIFFVIGLFFGYAYTGALGKPKPRPCPNCDPTTSTTSTTSSSTSTSTSTIIGGVECFDNDGDGYGVGAQCLGPDCNDNDANSYTAILCGYDGSACGPKYLCSASCPAIPGGQCTAVIDTTGGKPLLLDGDTIYFFKNTELWKAAGSNGWVPQLIGTYGAFLHNNLDCNKGACVFDNTESDGTQELIYVSLTGAREVIDTKSNMPSIFGNTVVYRKFIDSSHSILKLAARTSSGWVTQVLDDSTLPSSLGGVVNPSYDGSGVAYGYRAGTKLQLRVWSPQSGIEVADPGALGTYASLYQCGAGYVESGGDEIRVTHKTGGIWTLEQSYLVDFPIVTVYDAAGLSYHKSASSEVWFKPTSGTWQLITTTSAYDRQNKNFIYLGSSGLTFKAMS